MAGYRVTVRIGPRIAREHHDEALAALAALERQLRATAATTASVTRSALGREFAPEDQVAVRGEIAGPRRLRAGVDVRGDRSAEAWMGRIRRRIIAREAGEDAYAALRRAVLRAAPPAGG